MNKEVVVRLIWGVSLIIVAIIGGVAALIEAMDHDYAYGVFASIFGSIIFGYFGIVFLSQAYKEWKLSKMKKEGVDKKNPAQK